MTVSGRVMERVVNRQKPARMTMVTSSWITMLRTRRLLSASVAAISAAASCVCSSSSFCSDTPIAAAGFEQFAV